VLREWILVLTLPFDGIIHTFPEDLTGISSFLMSASLDVPVRRLDFPEHRALEIAKTASIGIIDIPESVVERIGV
jgi:hypothetical protein